MDYLWAALLALLAIVAWLSNLLSVPGNWILVGAAALYALLIEPSSPVAIGWWTVLSLAILALVGELVEFFAGAVGAARVGGSRRAAILALAGSLVGGFAGLWIGLPIPVVGPVLGALLLAGVGAFAGALLGERWLGRDLESSWRVGQAAFWGRLAGSLGKLLVGAAMVGFTVAAIIF